MPFPFAFMLWLKLIEAASAPFGTLTIETHPDYVATVWQPWRP